MKIIIPSAGMTDRAIAYDLCKYSNFENITITDKDRKNLQITEKFLENQYVNSNILDIKKTNDVKNYFEKNDIAISAGPYIYNYSITKIAIDTQTNLLDLGGNNYIVKKQMNLFSKAKKML